jgi:hypothetical protein
MNRELLYIVYIKEEGKKRERYRGRQERKEIPRLRDLCAYTVVALLTILLLRRLLLFSNRERSIIPIRTGHKVIYNYML